MAARGRGDLAAATAAYQDAAGRGEAAAEFALGRIHLTGQGATQSYPIARAWFEKAAAQGNPGAAYELGQMCEAGLGGPRDYAAALSWYQQSAARGYSPAMVNLAEMYRRGAGAARDLSAAISSVAPAAKAGDGAAELELGMLYMEAAHKPPQAGAALDGVEFRALMDRVFGRGKWRETSGYRTPAEENRLRAAGAGAVPVGETSRHSLGTEAAPGAYDVVVAGLAPDDAAARLLHASAKLSRVFAERAHASQGPHLHVELVLGGASARRLGNPSGGLMAQALPGTAFDATPAEFAQAARHWLQLAASHGEAKAGRLLATLRDSNTPG